MTTRPCSADQHAHERLQPAMNTTALRKTATSKPNIGLAAIYVLIVTGVFITGNVAGAAIWSAVYTVILAVCLTVDYRGNVGDIERDARYAARVAQLDEDAERRDIERDIERADHEARLASIRDGAGDPGPSAAVLEIQHRRQAERDAADEQYRVERAARQARIARRDRQSAS